MPGTESITAIDLIGDVVWDTHFAVRHFPAPGAEARATAQQRLLGGTAGHVARWLHLLAQAGLYAFPAPAIRLWATLESSAAQELPFCDLSGCHIVSHGTEVYILTRPDGEKAMMSYVPPGLPPRPVPTKSALFYLSAYTLMTADPVRQIVEPCERLVAKGAQLVFDLAPLIHLIDRKLILRLVSKARVAIGNDDEWTHLFYQTRHPHERTTAALKLGAGCVHLKRGAKGSRVAWGIGNGIELAPPPAQTVSTAGAGDAYTAAIVAARANDWDETWTALLASYCGTLHTEQHADAENIAALRHWLAQREQQERRPGD